MSETLKRDDHATAVVVAEASAWIALLHGPRRTSAAERGFREWLAESPVHRQAFEKATDTWARKRAAIRSAAQVEFVVPGLNRTPHRRSRGAMAAAAAVVLSIAAMVYVHWQPDVTTAIGERRNLVLEDGTQVSLNTSTRLTVDYGKRERRVRLEVGEAMFDVAKQADRPFVVSVGDRDVTALGTSFLVRRDGTRTAVTLIEGRVSVEHRQRSAASNGNLPASSSGSGQQRVSVKGILLLTPGERATFALDEPVPQVDRPVIEKLTAWQQGRVQIDNLTLAEAVEEMNRYNAVQLAVEGAQAAQLRISGMFRIGDVQSFADAVAQTHGLHVQEEDRRIVLSGTPRRSSARTFDTK